MCMAAIALVSGVFQALSLKWQNRERTAPCDECVPEYFNQAFLQTLFMFAGELLCFAVYYSLRLTRRARRASFAKATFSRPPDSTAAVRDHQLSRLGKEAKARHGKRRDSEVELSSLQNVGGKRASSDGTTAQGINPFAPIDSGGATIESDGAPHESRGARELRLVTSDITATITATNTGAGIGGCENENENDNGRLGKGEAEHTSIHTINESRAWTPPTPPTPTYETLPLYGTVDCPLWWWLTPAPLDFVECALGNMATTITYASTVQMLHNFMVVASALFCLLILKRPLRVHEWLGCFVVTSALVLTGIPAIERPETTSSAASSRHWLGILLAILSTCVHALQNVWEEHLFCKGRISTLLAVGIEGSAGCVITLAALPLVHLSGLENIGTGLRQLRRSRTLQMGSAIYAVASFLNNAAGIAVTKWSSALLRCLFMAARPPLVWLAEMLLRWNAFDWCNFAAMFVLAFGLHIHVLGPPFDRQPFFYYLRKPVNIFGLRLPSADEQTEVSSLFSVSPQAKRSHQALRYRDSYSREQLTIELQPGTNNTNTMNNGVNGVNGVNGAIGANIINGTNGVIRLTLPPPEGGHGDECNIMEECDSLGSRSSELKHQKRTSTAMSDTEAETPETTFSNTQANSPG